jgi:hypothetical protein
VERIDRWVVKISNDQTGSFTMPKAKKRSNRSRAKTATAKYFVDDVLALAGTLASRKKEWGAERIAEFAEATREFATSMTAVPNLGNYVNAAAESLENFSDYVRETEFEQIITDASTFARHHPIVVVTGGALVGLVAMQILRSDGPILKVRRSAKSAKSSGNAGKTRAAATGSSKRINGHAHLH